MRKLGFGLMRLPLTDPNDQASIDIEKFKAMADRFIEQGFTYFDTAYPYHGGKSEEALREVVVKRYPREAFTVTSKMPVWAIKEEGDLERIFNEQLEKCGVDYFDYYWLHALNRERVKVIEQMNGWSFLSRKKAEGRIRHIGFSFHDSSDLLAEILPSRRAPAMTCAHSMANPSSSWSPSRAVRWPVCPRWWSVCSRTITLTPAWPRGPSASVPHCPTC